MVFLFVPLDLSLPSRVQTLACQLRHLFPLPSPAVETFSLVKQFGDFVAVDHIDLQVRRGSFFGFLGTERSRQVNYDQNANRLAAANQRKTARAWS